ncbi:tetratricopeptide repeat protein [Natronosporangium hydrolyticum]|uniref:Tetratricopeptide repeat protein n=1 Tax=Natronosporangium hydrolyticum TaxID=2811111 RepID=A0A895YK52_9ACTN|nr:BTAD domain-containing putative transcriptional regulator [Natronosporangium hydrolyticum]QSB14198.1 tetratricopeptide repeat protein [Natronosporangium hydrolyticum]
MVQPEQQLGAVLRHYRLRAGFTQQDLARESGMSVRGLRDLENDRIRRPHRRSVERLTAALQLSKTEEQLILAAAAAADGPEKHPRVAVLGALEVRLDQAVLNLGSGHQRCLLALLALQYGQVVSQREIVDVLWQQEPPATSSNLVHVYVSRLRRLLTADATTGRRRQPMSRVPLLERTCGGYRLTLTGGALDLVTFDDLLAAADQARARQQPTACPEAADLLARALRCWRGPVLGRAEPRLSDHPAAVMVSNRRIDAALTFADIAMTMGRHDEVATLLRPLALDEPLHEGVHARLMLALAAGGQQAAALAVFETISRRLVEELGIDPSQELSAARLTVLRGRHSTTPAAEVVIATESGFPAGAPEAPQPAQLPVDIATFTGREEHLRELDSLIPEVAGPGRSTVVNLCVLTGMAGVGKTALAVHWAHRVRHQFPDGQLFVDLRGFSSSTAARPVDVIGRFLRSLNVPASEVPVELDEAAALFRSLTADRALLIVLDNAGHAEQVRPLLPGGPRCLALVTSRDSLGGLAVQQGAPRLSIDVLPPADALTLLTRSIGADRVAREPAAAAALAQACASLPLALQVAAANVTDRVGSTIADYVADLSAANRLAVLQINGDSQAAVRAAFDLSYTHLPAHAQRLFRLVGLAPGDDVTVETSAALGGVSPERARESLDELTRAHLLRHHASGRYAMHDLLRLYAVDRAAREDDGTERQRALVALYDHYLLRVDDAADLLYPAMLRLPRGDTPHAVRGTSLFADEAAATAWLDAERANLIALIRTAAEQGPYPFAWRLGDALRGYFFLGVDPVGWLTVAHAALASAEAQGDAQAQAAAHLNTIGGLIRQSRPAQARLHAERMLLLARRAQWADGEAAAQGSLGELNQMLGRPKEAAEHYSQALELVRRTGRLGGLSINLNNLGVVYCHIGRLDEAAELFQEALQLERSLRSRTGEAVSLANLGEVQHLLGHLHVALEDLTKALTICRETVYRSCEAEALRCLAALYWDLGDRPQALEHAEEALTVARGIGYRTSEVDALNILGALHRDGNQLTEARERHGAALSLSLDAHHRYGEGQALVGLARVHIQVGEPASALPLVRRALGLADRLHYRFLHKAAEAALAEANLALAHQGQRPA